MKKMLLAALTLLCITGTAAAEDQHVYHREKLAYLPKHQTAEEYQESMKSALTWAEAMKMPVSQLAAKSIEYYDIRDWYIDMDSITRGKELCFVQIIEVWDEAAFSNYADTFMQNKRVQTPDYRYPEWLKPITVYGLAYDPGSDSWAVLDKSRYEYDYTGRYLCDIEPVFEPLKDSFPVPRRVVLEALKYINTSK